MSSEGDGLDTVGGPQAKRKHHSQNKLCVIMLEILQSSALAQKRFSLDSSNKPLAFYQEISSVDSAVRQQRGNYVHKKLINHLAVKFTKNNKPVYSRGVRDAYDNKGALPLIEIRQASHDDCMAEGSALQNTKCTTLGLSCKQALRLRIFYNLMKLKPALNICILPSRC